MERVQGELRTATEDRLRAVDRRNELLRQLDTADAAPSAASAPNPSADRLDRKKDELGAEAALQRQVPGGHPPQGRSRHAREGGGRAAGAESARADRREPIG